VQEHERSTGAELALAHEPTANADPTNIRLAAHNPSVNEPRPEQAPSYAARRPALQPATRSSSQ
jgi:hypothetical protein